MPADDLVLNVKQIAGYPPISNAPTNALLLMQLGIGGPYQSISPQALVETALAAGGAMSIAGALAVQSIQGGSAQFSNATLNVLSAQKACVVDFAATWGSIAGVPIATVNDVADLNAAIRAASVWSFNGRLGDVRLWIDDIVCAGGAPIFSPRFEGSPRACTPPPTSNSSRIATTAFVAAAIGGAELVTSFNGRVGAIVLTADDVTAADPPYAPIDSPNFTGYATSLTPPLGTATGQIATTAFVMNAVADATAGVASFNGRTGIVVLTAADLAGAGGAPLASPTFTGTPAAPTAAPGTATTQLATTAFVSAATGGGSFAPLNSPAFTGTPTGPTAAVGNDTTQLATTAFVMSEINAVNAGVISFNGRSGAVSLLANDISAAGGATLASPAFTGAPTAPTAAANANTTQIATCAFVTAAIAALPAPPAASAATPLVNGTASVGVDPGYSRGDHVHPTDTTRAAQASLANYAPLAGATFTGSVQGPAATFTNSVTSNLFSVGGVSPAGDMSLSGSTNLRNISLAGASGYYFQLNLTTGDLNWVANNTTAFFVDFGGSMTLTTNISVGSNGFKPGGGEWAALSDARIKTVDGDYEAGLDEVLALRPVVYRYRGNDTPTSALDETPQGPRAYRGAVPYPASRHAIVAKAQQRFVGLLAQEVEPIFPGMVTKVAAWIDGRAVDDLRQMDRTELIFAVVNAIKTLAARLDALEAA